MDSAFALYYPFIHFRDEAWIKQAALYWDRLGRIVPDGYGEKLHDSDVVKALRDEAGFVSDSTPDPKVVKSVGAELAAFIDRYADILRAQLKPDPYQPGSLAYIYHSKMDDALVAQLRDTGLGTFRRNEGDQPDEWLGVHEKVGQAYMTALASGMASGGKQSVVSDNPRFAVAGCGFPVRQLFANLIEDPKLDLPVGKQAESMLGAAAITRVLPKNLDAVPIEKIIEFRSETVLQRANYRKAIADATAGLEEVRDEHALREHLEVRGEQIDAAVKDLDHEMNRLLGDTALSVIGVSKDLPELAGAGMAVVGVATVNPVVVVAGFAFNAFKAVRDGRRKNKELRDKPYAYLIAAHEALGVTETLERLRLGARNLIIG